MIESLTTAAIPSVRTAGSSADGPLPGSSLPPRARLAVLVLEPGACGAVAVAREATWGAAAPAPAKKAAAPQNARAKLVFFSKGPIFGSLGCESVPKPIPAGSQVPENTEIFP